MEMLLILTRRIFNSSTRNLALIALAVCGLSPFASASTMRAIPAFRERLSDGRDTIVASDAASAYSYANGQFSGGPVWETGAARVQIVSGTDLRGPRSQIGKFEAAHPTPDSIALYTIWIGSNDLFDILVDSIVASPSRYGFTDVPAPCLMEEVDDSGGTFCDAPNKYLFEIHPIAAGHGFAGSAEVTPLVTPEPAYVSLITAGLLGLVPVFRRQRG